MCRKMAGGITHAEYEDLVGHCGVIASKLHLVKFYNDVSTHKSNRHCERSAAIQRLFTHALDCRVASLLAMTINFYKKSRNAISLALRWQACNEAKQEKS
jgi:hypothetical protein